METRFIAVEEGERWNAGESLKGVGQAAVLLDFVPLL
jgi:hypothetical protein